jgi:hypothetical protein
LFLIHKIIDQSLGLVRFFTGIDKSDLSQSNKVQLKSRAEAGLQWQAANEMQNDFKTVERNADIIHHNEYCGAATVVHSAAFRGGILQAIGEEKDEDCCKSYESIGQEGLTVHNLRFTIRVVESD